MEENTSSEWQARRRVSDRAMRDAANVRSRDAREYLLRARKYI